MGATLQQVMPAERVVPSPMDGDDTRFMQAVIAYARRGLGQAAPNPSVGALIVRDGIIVGRGVTRPGGRPHAETIALAQAGALARGATMYVTLEPCSHYGVTAPCCDAIVTAGVARVVCSSGDPDPRVSGRGFARMRAAGLTVSENVCAEAAARLNLGHVLRMTQGRPMVTLKLAETADGFAAGDAHDSRLMITGEAANGRVRMLRALHDAIMVGIGTAKADDPLLTLRSPGLERLQPARVVLDARLELSPLSRLVATLRDAPLFVIAGHDASMEREAALARAGLSILRCAPSGDGRLDMGAALKALGQRGITRVFSEGGPRVAESLILGGFADDVIIVRNDKRLGHPGLPALSPAARAALGDGARYCHALDARLSGDLFQHFERRL